MEISFAAANEFVCDDFEVAVEISFAAANANYCDALLSTVSFVSFVDNV